AVSPLVRQGISVLAPQALHIVDGFGIPDALLNAPIALDWERFNEYDNKGEIVRQESTMVAKL
ncbi:hypothetical protein H4R34_004731, partial [Dimargaris verticillata]